jgi:hypothetical protein
MHLPSLVLAATVAAALGLSACGGENAKLLPGETAREITANLDTVKQLAGEGDCVGAESAARQVGEQIEALEGVDPKLKRALEEGAARLEEAIAGCEESSSEAIAPAEVPAEPEEEAEKEAKQKEAKSKEEKPREQSQEQQPKEEEAAPETGEEQPAEEAGGAPSGGVSPGTPVEGGK